MGKVTNKMLKTESTRFLPDEIIIIILSFLPAKIVMRFRLVCKSWRDLTVSRDFVDSQLKNSLPTIFASTLTSDYSLSFDFCTLEKWWEPARTMLKVRRFPLYSGMFDKFHSLLFSHGGLVVLKDGCYRRVGKASFFILNPLRPSDEHVRITLSKNLWNSKINGIYFHPSLKEYCSLWKIIESLGPPCYERIKRIQYKVLNLGSIPSLKTISYPFTDRDEEYDATPLFFNNYLYWLLKPERFKSRLHNDIMMFDIVKEEFMIIPCPVPVNTKCDAFKYQTYVQNIDGILSFLLIVPSKINIWRLEDHAEQLWIAFEYTLNIPKNFLVDYPAGIIALVDKKLALLLERRLVVCDLTDGTMKKYPKENMYWDYVLVLSHRMSLASLNNCKPNISIGHDGEEVVVRVDSNDRGPLRQYVRKSLTRARKV